MRKADLAAACEIGSIGVLDLRSLDGTSARKADNAQPSGSAACVQATGAKKRTDQGRVVHVIYLGSVEPKINLGRISAIGLGPVLSKPNRRRIARC
jgi:hypothetical protein